MTADERDVWAGRAIFALAVAAGVAFVIFILVALTDPPVRQSLATAIAAGFGALVGLIALYLRR